MLYHGLNLSHSEFIMLPSTSYQTMLCISTKMKSLSRTSTSLNSASRNLVRMEHLSRGLFECIFVFYVDCNPLWDQQSKNDVIYPSFYLHVYLSLFLAICLSTYLHTHLYIFLILSTSRPPNHSEFGGKNLNFDHSQLMFRWVSIGFSYFSG